MQATPNTQALTTTLLDECHNIVVAHLQHSLQKMFENSNMAFLDFAEKAESSASQIQFMEGLSHLQKNRSAVEGSFFSELAKSFNHFGNQNLQGAPEENSEDSPLALVSKDETDIQVAIQSMTQSATAGSATELAGLRKRLAILNNGKKIETRDIPGSPSCLANAFHEAASPLIMEHETMLIVYMLYNKYVFGKLQHLYDEYNKCLIKAGLLPNLKYAARKNPTTGKDETVEIEGDAASSSAPPRPSGNAPQSNTAGNQSLGDELFNNIMHLLAGPGGAGPAVSNPLPQIEIVTAIDNVQHAAASVEVIGPEEVIKIQPGSDDHKNIIASMTKRLSAEREQLFEGIDRRRLPAADTQVIELVGMMFDYLLNDDDLPNVAKAELCRLHTPYLKIAIIDKSFFTDNSHPAHELLNTLSNAAARWVFEDNLERGIFYSIRNIVRRVNNEFVNNVELFSELLGVFRRSLNELIDKSTAIEERARQAVAGKEKLGLARKHAAQVIEGCIIGHNVPALIRKMLGDVWLDKLMFIYLREPDASDNPSWHLTIRTINDIIWSVEPRFTEESQTELRAKLPMLRNKIAQHLLELDAYGTCDNEAQLKLIAGLQKEALNQPVNENAPVTASIEEPAQQSGKEENALVLEAEAKELEEELSDEVKAALSDLKEIAFGTWFIIQRCETEHPIRVKLSWYSKLSNNYMFVNSMGVKSTVLKQNDLATMLAEGKARIIDETRVPFVKRAMEAVRRILVGG